MLLLFTACAGEETSNQQLDFVIGVISYEEGKQAIERFTRFRNYLGEKLGAIIQLEPAFSQNLALERIKNGDWSLVFAPPGLAAIASANYQYLPIFPLQIEGTSRSIFVVRKDSPLNQFKDLQGKIVALGQPGSAAGYYFPLFNLYGFTLAEILFAPTPKTVLESVAQGKAAAGAISLEEFNLYRTEFGATEFRILFSNPQTVPLGAVLIGGSNAERNRLDRIRNCMKNAPPSLVQDIGYLPNSDAPDYQYMNVIVKRVTSIAQHLNCKPVRLF